MIDLLKKELSALQKISSAAVRAENGEALLEQTLDVLTQEMAMLRGTFTLRRGDAFRIEVSRGLGEDERRRGIYRLGVGVTGTVAETGKPCLVPDISKDARFLNLTGARAETRGIAFLCVPVVHREDVVGTLSIDCEKEPLPRLQEKLRFLEIVGSLAAEAAAERQQVSDERDALKRENLELREFIGESGSPGRLIGNSALIRGVCARLSATAASQIERVEGTTPRRTCRLAFESSACPPHSRTFQSSNSPRGRAERSQSGATFHCGSIVLARERAVVDRWEERRES